MIQRYFTAFCSFANYVVVLNRRKNQFTIVPVMVGSLTPEKEAFYGSIFSPYLADPSNL
jgi:hypothetical protein